MRFLQVPCHQRQSPSQTNLPGTFKWMLNCGSHKSILLMCCITGCLIFFKRYF